jgi:NitT/TauT family transport system permease protein
MNWINGFKGLKEKSFLPCALLVVILCFWQFSCKFFSIPEYILPPPLKIFFTFKRMGYLLFKHSLVTLWEILAGFAIGTILGFLLALLISLSKFLQKAFYPLIISVQSVPKLALGPLFIIWFGFGVYPKIAITALVVFFPVLVNTVAGLTVLEPELLDLARSMRASASQILFKIRIPHSIPYIFMGLKVSVTFAVAGATIGEFLGADRGLGYIIMLSSMDLDTGRLFAAIILLSVMGSLLFGLVCLLERIILPWYINEE